MGESEERAARAGRRDVGRADGAAQGRREDDDDGRADAQGAVQGRREARAGGAGAHGPAKRRDRDRRRRPRLRRRERLALRGDTDGRRRLRLGRAVGQVGERRLATERGPNRDGQVVRAHGVGRVCAARAQDGRAALPAPVLLVGVAVAAAVARHRVAARRRVRHVSSCNRPCGRGT